MPIVLEVVSGPGAGSRLELRDGHVLRFGRGPRADLRIPEDPALSDPHFLVSCKRGECTLRVLSDAGATFLNGSIVKREARLRDSDRITAGMSSFRVGMDDHARV